VVFSETTGFWHTEFLEVQEAPSQVPISQREVGLEASTGYFCSVPANAPHDAPELAEKVREAICAEWQAAGGALRSAVVHQRLLEKGVEVPAYQMSAILNAFRVGGLIAVSLAPQREEDVRKHGDLLIRGVSSELCHSS
jgi:hypothetical protein